jgi:hypothetical protein
MQLKRQLKEQGIFLMEKFKPITEVVKRWVWVFSTGLALGLILGTQSAYFSIVKDCKIMGMFRYGDAPMSCTYHLVTMPVYDSIPMDKPKEKKK